jgi:hypothetical protein
LPRLNDTHRAPAEFAVDIERELTPVAFALLNQRTRLDFKLWREVVERRHATLDSGALRAATLRASIERQKFVQAAL